MSPYCLWSLSSVSRPGHYEACWPVGCSPLKGKGCYLSEWIDYGRCRNCHANHSLRQNLKRRENSKDLLENGES